MSWGLETFARNRGETILFPTPKAERWRFSQFDRWLKKRFSSTPSDAPGSLLPPLTPYRIVLKNGKLHSHTLPDGVTLSAETAPLPSHPENPFGTLAAHPDGETALTLKGDINECIHILHLYGEGAVVPSSCRLILEEKANAKIIESFEGGREGFVLHKTSVLLGPGSSLLHAHVQLLDKSAAAVTELNEKLEKDASAEHYALQLGCAFHQHFVQSSLFEKSSLKLRALLKGEERSRRLLCCDALHEAPKTRSDLMAKHVLKEQSTGVFDARSVVSKSAEHSVVKQASHGLLLNDGACVHAKPHLEIFIDELKASHGATVGELDEQALGYLQSRGIPGERARAMLIEAFTAGLFEELQDTTFKTLISQLTGGDHDTP